MKIINHILSFPPLPLPPLHHPSLLLLPSALPYHLPPPLYPHQGMLGFCALSSHCTAVHPGGVTALPRTF